jgi:hypothetical protein
MLPVGSCCWAPSASPSQPAAVPCARSAREDSRTAEASRRLPTAWPLRRQQAGAKQSVQPSGITAIGARSVAEGAHGEVLHEGDVLGPPRHRAECTSARIVGVKRDAPPSPATQGWTVCARAARCGTANRWRLRSRVKEQVARRGPGQRGRTAGRAPKRRSEAVPASGASKPRRGCAHGALGAGRSPSWAVVELDYPRAVAQHVAASPRRKGRSRRSLRLPISTA